MHEGTFWGGRNRFYFDCGAIYTTICQNSPIIKSLCTLLYVNDTSVQSI